MIAKKWVEPGTLYLVGTPIGNQSDWTFRALDVLAEVDRVLAEDTRETRQLFHAHDIHTPLVSLHEHNWRQRLPDIRRWLEAGEALALVSDRGMPAVSDPGQEVVDYCRTEGFPVSVVPGPSAVVTAFAASGFPPLLSFGGFCRAGGGHGMRDSRKSASRLIPKFCTKPLTVWPIRLMNWRVIWGTIIRFLSVER